MEKKRLIDCFYGMNYHLPFPRKNDLDLEVRATRYRNGPNMPLYQGT
jgi:hypothetical protein